MKSHVPAEIPDFWQSASKSSESEELQRTHIAKGIVVCQLSNGHKEKHWSGMECFCIRSFLSSKTFCGTKLENTAAGLIVDIDINAASTSSFRLYKSINWKGDSDTHIARTPHPSHIADNLPAQAAPGNQAHAPTTPRKTFGIHMAPTPLCPSTTELSAAFVPTYIAPTEGKQTTTTAHSCEPTLVLPTQHMPRMS